MPQIDYPAYMDLNFSGISDKPLADALAQCKLGYLILPRNGKPFSMFNIYTGRYLFSDEVRIAFGSHYSPIDTRRFFSVYNCNNPLTNSIKLSGFS